MPKWLSAAFALFLSLQVFSTKGETVDYVINKYVEAMGGRDRLISIKTVYSEAVTPGKGGNSIIVRTYKEQDKLFRRTISSGSNNNLLVITNSNGWNSDPNGAATFQNWTKESILKAQPELDCAGPLVDYISKGYVAELAGKQEVNGISCHTVKLTLKSGLVIKYFIDSENWYVIREIRKGYDPANTADLNSEMIFDYSNYRKTQGGYVFPFKVLSGIFSNKALNYQKIEVNKPVNYRLYKTGYKKIP
ncbi:MAG: hypothetical protein ABIN89_18225 [Chitinophagaceae bacterium]